MPVTKTADLCIRASYPFQAIPESGELQRNGVRRATRTCAMFLRTTAHRATAPQPVALAKDGMLRPDRTRRICRPIADNVRKPSVWFWP
jgi:hypothetical protein